MKRPELQPKKSAGQRRKLPLLVSLTFLCSVAVAATEPDLPPEIAASLAQSTPLSGGKVVRKRMAELSPSEQLRYRAALNEMTNYKGDPEGRRLCAGVSVSCRTNADENYVDIPKSMKTAVVSKAALGNVRVSLADVTESQLKEFSLVGYFPEGVNGSPWTWVSRLYEGKQGDFVYLKEWDFVATGGGILLVEEFFNAKIGPYDAAAMLNISTKGNKLWHVTWTEPQKKMDFYYECASRCISESAFLAMASSLYDPKAKAQASTR